MHEETITVKFIREPDKFPDIGSLKSDTEAWYSVPKNMLSLFEIGKSYLVGYTTNAKGYHTIKQMTPSGIRTQSLPAPYSPAVNGGAERGMLTKIAVDLLARGQWNEDEIYGMIKAGQRITERVMAVKELEETF